MDKPKKSFPCTHCFEKPFTTLQNLKRHITRKHKDIDLIQQETERDDVSVLSTNTTIISINYLSDNDIEEPEPQPHEPRPYEPIPSDEYLINLRNEYIKYQHLYTGIDNRIKWNANNINVNMDFHRQRHTLKMRYILFKIALLNKNI
jgi:hypothetical protein